MPPRCGTTTNTNAVPFTLDRRCPVVRRGPRGVRVLPASPPDDRQLPAVPPAQSLEVRRPLHEFYKRGKSTICNHDCFPLLQKLPSRSSAAARSAGTEARGRGVGSYRAIKNPPLPEWVKRDGSVGTHQTAVCPERQNPVFAFRITLTWPQQNIQNKPSTSMVSPRLVLAFSCVKSGQTPLSAATPAPSRLPFLFQNHLLGAHQRLSEQPPPGGSAHRCLRAEERLWQRAALSKGEPGERGGSPVPSLFSVIMISRRSAHVWFVCTWLKHADRLKWRLSGCRELTEGGEQWQEAASPPASPKHPAQHAAPSPHAHTPGFALSAKSSHRLRKK